MSQYLSIDIGGTKTKYGLLDASGNILEKKQISTPGNKEQFLSKIDGLVEKYHTNIKGLAFCAPGKVDHNQISFGGSLPFLDGINFTKCYKEQYGLSTSVINDGKASVLAENWLGSLKDEPNCADITLGTAVGGGIIINGQLLSGVHSQAGEFSFMIHDYQHAKHMEGNVGGSDSAVNLVKEINNATDFNGDKTDGYHAFELIENQDPIASKIFKEYCLKIAILILNIQSVVDIRKVAIGGGISENQLVVQGINKAYRHLVCDLNPMIGDTLTAPQIVEASFKNSANLFGALYNLLLEIDNK